MPKRPEQPDSVDRARIERERLERIDRDVRRNHPGAEDSDPPAPERTPTLTQFPPPSIDRRPDGGFPKQEGPLEKHANFWGPIGKIAGGVTAVVSIIGGGFTYAVKYVVRDEIAQFRNDLDPLALKQKRKEPDDPKPLSLEDRFDAQNQKLDAIDKKIGSPSDPASDLGKKLDRIDEILHKQFGESTKTTPPPSLGPTAKQKGRQ